MLKKTNKMLISIAKWYKNCSFVVSKHSNICVYIAFRQSYTNDNTPSLPLNNAHSEGFFFLCYE